VHLIFAMTLREYITDIHVQVRALPACWSQLPNVSMGSLDSENPCEAGMHTQVRALPRILAAAMYRMNLCNKKNTYRVAGMHIQVRALLRNLAAAPLPSSGLHVSHEMAQKYAYRVGRHPTKKTWRNNTAFR